MNPGVGPVVFLSGAGCTLRDTSKRLSDRQVTLCRWTGVAVQIYAELRPLPPGVLIAAQRHVIDGETVILIASAEPDDGATLTVGEFQAGLYLWLQAINQVLAADESDTEPVTIRRHRQLAS